MSGPPRKRLVPTATTKAHRFETFTQRIGKIKIDPVHTVQRARISGDHNDLSTSYFRTALEEWTELNLTSTFTSFLNKTNNLAESLPQILHHADDIYGCFQDHIGRKDELALEPLLSLLAHFAHDLGQQFAKYLDQTVKLVMDVAAAVEDPAAIENCFTCLAWMYKYMFRSLVQDLRPLLTLAIPYMSAKKEHLRRFTAESLAYLVRKAAVMYPKKQEPLFLALEYLFRQTDVKNKINANTTYEDALMRLLTESTMGVEARLHSTAVDIFNCAFGLIVEDLDLYSAQRATVVLEGCTVFLIHQTNAIGFKPLLDLIVRSARLQVGTSAKCDQLFQNLLLVTTATRKGSRIGQWGDVIEVLEMFLLRQFDSPDNKIQNDILKTSTVCAAVVQYASMDQLLPHLAKFLDTILLKFTSTTFFAFCEMVAGFGKQRFQDLLLPRLQQYIIMNWQKTEIGLCYLLHQLHRQGFVGKTPNNVGYLKSTDDWDRHIISQLTTAPNSGVLADSVSHYFLLMESIHVARDQEKSMALQKLLHSVIGKTLQRDKLSFTPAIRLTLGWALNAYLRSSQAKPHELWNRMIKEQDEAFQMQPFLAACIEVTQMIEHHQSHEYDYGYATELLNGNMLSVNVELRKRSLQVLRGIAQLTGDSWLDGTTELLLEIISMPYMPSNSRQLAMLVRKLPFRQKDAHRNALQSKLIPLFAMGMLQNYHDQPRRDLCEAIKLMVTNGSSEQVIIDTSLQWLQLPAISDLRSIATQSHKEFTGKLSAFECSNLKSVIALCQDVYHQHSNAQTSLALAFQQAHELQPPRTPDGGRSLALQVLLEIPEVIERRSRVLVPIFLSMAGSKPNMHVPRSDDSTSSHTISPDVDEHLWTLKDRKLFLELFSKFGNPKVLYRAHEVYDMHLELLANGNPEIRTLALKTLLNWKTPTLKQYEEVLLRVAEEKTANSELASLLGRNDDTNSVKLSDRDIVLPVLLRLILGQVVGRSSGHGSQEAKRKTILRLLFRMEHNEILSFLEIALGRLSAVRLTEDGHFPEHVWLTDIVSSDQQYGFLRMVLSMMEVSQSQFASYGGAVVSSVVYCTIRASKQLFTDQNIVVKTPALLRSIRKTGLQCLTILFKECSNIGWAPYLPSLFEHVISPRLQNFAIETAQGISGLLQLFSSWVLSPSLFSILTNHDSHVLEAILATISEEIVRDEVKIFAIDNIIAPLTNALSAGSPDSDLASGILRPKVNQILDAFSLTLARQPGKGVLESVTHVIPALAPLATAIQSTNEILAVLIALLSQSSQKMQPHIKSKLLEAVHGIILSNSVDISVLSRDNLFEVSSRLYDYFKDVPNRDLLGRVLHVLSQSDPSMLLSVNICQDLNAVSGVQLDEVDYDKRLSAYHAIGKLDVVEMSRQQLQPILHNLVFLARTANDFSIRSNAVTALKTYIVKACAFTGCPAQALIGEVILPAAKKASRDDSEHVRADFVNLYGMMVRYLENAEDLRDMKILLVGDDEEASFFSNILHIQQHRRVRAIRRLVQEAENGRIQPTNIDAFFLPLLEKFINDVDSDDTTSGTKGHSMSAISELLKWVDWKVFRKYLRQYRQDLETGTRPERDAIKLLNNAADALSTSIAALHNDSSSKPFLTKSLPQTEALYDELRTNFIPKLAKFIHHKDESQISLRLPAAKVAIKLVKLLPADETSNLASPMILDISQILRSRAQESRDVARNTLAELVGLLGPASMQFVLKQLRTTLTRGYQLHVLSFTVHTILLTSLTGQVPGELDYCVEDITTVIMDDIFGAVGQEKENQDYVSSMREVKKNKSFDTMELLARSVSVKSLSKLVKPFQALLNGFLTSKQIRQVDDLLRRLGVGIAHNPAASSQEILVFAFEMMQTFYKEKAGVPGPVLTNDQKNRQRYLIQLDSAAKTTVRASTSLLYKLARFALDLVRSTMLKHPLLLSAENVHGFLPMVGDAVVQGQEDVKLSAFRFLSAIVKLPLRDLDENAALYVMEAVKIVKSSTSTSEESAQAALKFVTAVLRDRKQVEVRDSDLAYLLQRTMPDLEEPDQQGITFNFLKAILARGYQLPEVYDIVDSIGTIMVTNQTRSIRDSARGVFVHFLLDYPQSEKRWSKQLKFLVSNLDYQHPEGRQSVMEAVYSLLQKSDKHTCRDLITTMFIPVVLRMANDDHTECREMAAALLSQLYRKCDETQLHSLLEPLRSWAEQTESPNLRKLALQAWKLFFETSPSYGLEEVSNIRTAIGQTLKIEHERDTWELHFHALELLRTLASVYPAIMMSSKQRDIWSRVMLQLDSDHIWVQGSAASLFRVFLQDCIADSTEQTNGSLSGTHGLKFDFTTFASALRSCTRILKRNVDSIDLSATNLENLLLLMKLSLVKGLTMVVKNRSVIIESDGSEDDTSADELRNEPQTTSIPALQYVVNQMTLVLRREPEKFTTAAFLPRISALQLLTALFSEIDTTSLPQDSITALLMPLLYITGLETKPPRSVDSTFEETFKSYFESAQLLLEALRSKLGDTLYVKLMTEASKTMRQRRQERRQKRAIERIVEPEKAARDKRRKVERQKERRKEVKDIYRKGRRKDLGF